ncbi:MAG: hypothetical protein ABXS92_01090 [Sulfurimonas sp.]
MLQKIKLSLLYFMVVFTVGFILGTIRVIFLVPAIGEKWAELLEMPFMLIAIMYTAKYLVNKHLLLSLRDWLTIGFLALCLLLCIEFTLILGLRGISLSEYIASRDIVSGSAYAISLVIYMLMPSYIYRFDTRRR